MSPGSRGGRGSKTRDRERILPEHRLGLRRQAVEPLAHVGGTRRQPHPGARRQTIHRSQVAKVWLIVRGSGLEANMSRFSPASST
jgi:hypothetical protein